MLKTTVFEISGECSKEEAKKKFPTKNNRKLYDHLIGGRRKHRCIWYFIDVVDKPCHHCHCRCHQINDSYWHFATVTFAMMTIDHKLWRMHGTTPKNAMIPLFEVKIIIINWIDFDRVWTSISDVFFYCCDLSWACV